jgi:glucose/arabinose dehydrogenase
MSRIIATCLFLSLCIASAEAQIRLVPIATNLDKPVDIVNAGDASGRLFIVLQVGKIVIYDGTSVLTKPFLNIQTSVSCCGEEGLLSLVFHPDYENNRLFYVYYVDTGGDLVLARFKTSANPNVARKRSKRILLKISHPNFGNHNGGKLQFGRDGYLYLSVGDGGGGGDPNDNAQNLGSLLGKILRIDVDSASPYAIPPDNPFANRPQARPEIWSYGLRNPWRITFDRRRGNLYIGDVGQGEWEEINYQRRRSPGGVNYGWRKMEGKHCFNPSLNCNSGSLKPPIIEYNHSQGCSVTGGFVYRGSAIPALTGTYLFADYCSGVISGAKRSSGQWVVSRLLSSGKNISTFGEDEAGELYIAHHSTNGEIYRLAED